MLSANMLKSRRPEAIVISLVKKKDVVERPPHHSSCYQWRRLSLIQINSNTEILELSFYLYQFSYHYNILIFIFKYCCIYNVAHYNSSELYWDKTNLISDYNRQKPLFTFFDIFVNLKLPSFYKPESKDSSSSNRALEQ